MKVSIIGAGLIGRRRAQIALEYGDTVTSIFDSDAKRASDLASEIKAGVAGTEQEAIAACDIAVISTPNRFLLPNAVSALEARRHVLIEKPMCRNLVEASELAAVHKNCGGPILKIGFNHRYHPAISRAHEIVKSGTIGEIKFIRAVYGHGGRPGYEKEWRGDKEMAGGGELTDQGVHLLDLICWFNPLPRWAFAQRRTFAWPLNDLEDNGFFMLGWEDNSIAQVHTSWTQWKNRFAFHIYGESGAVEIDGLGGSYGEERLKIYKRKPEGGAPDMEELSFPEKDNSWLEEWKDFRKAIDAGRPHMGCPDDGLHVMKILDAIYKSCDSAEKVIID